MSYTKLEVIANSYPAPSKPNRINEDQIYVNQENNLYWVMDGLGGHGNGNYASYYATLMLHKELEKIDTLKVPKIIPIVLENAINQVNSIMFSIANSNQRFQDFGTTIALLYVSDNIVYTANVGDSSIYVFNDALSELSTSDSVSYTGMSQCVGRQEISVHTNSREIQKGDIFLLATDGLTDTISNYEIEKILSNKSKNWKKLLDEKVRNPKWALKSFARNYDMNVKDAQKKLAGKDDTSYIIINSGRKKWLI